MAARASGRDKKRQSRPSEAPVPIAAKDAISLAAEGLGGFEGLVAWVRSDPKNEQVFWTSIYPKLMPLQHPPEREGDAGIKRIERLIVRPPNSDR